MLIQPYNTCINDNTSHTDLLPIRATSLRPSLQFCKISDVLKDDVLWAEIFRPKFLGPVAAVDWRDLSVRCDVVGRRTLISGDADTRCDEFESDLRWLARDLCVVNRSDGSRDVLTVT